MNEYKFENHPEEVTRSSPDYTVRGKLSNPFPGLRPFDADEAHLFFGRESQVDEIIAKLADNRFIGLLGYSGSGKSSLMNCGVLPAICGGFLEDAGTDWNIIKTRPGDDPINNLATSICEKLYTQNRDKSYAKIQISLVNALLRSGSDGFVNVLGQIPEHSGNKTILVIDQFEELFRFQKKTDPSQIHDDRGIYIELLMESVMQSELPIYVALSMRSDFIGNCAAYPKLNDLINSSNYLVPRMTREQKRDAIVGPVAVGGGHISERLVKRLLFEIGDNQDQLPILQHALMRAWNFWELNKEENEPIDIRHYNAIGQLSGALSQHADEIYESIDPGQKQITETIFKLLTQKGQDNKGLRRPAKIADIAEVAGVGEAQVIEVVEHFRKTGRSFLMPGEGIILSGDSIIEISHESLMRIWVRLKSWVDEEYESAQMYIRLSEAATMYQIGQTGLWRPPDLQLALSWQKKQRPTKVWGRRYYEAFERAIVFLDTSRITYEAEQKNQELLQKRVLRRARYGALFFGLAAIIAISFFVYGVIQQGIAEREADLARLNEKNAVDARNEAEKERQNAYAQTRIAELATDSIVITNLQLKESYEKLSQSLRNESAAKKAAEQQRLEAISQAKIAERERDRADSTKEVVIRVSTERERLLYLSVAQSMALKSQNIEDSNLKGLLAHQAYLFHTEFEGRKFDPFIYNGLYSSLAQFGGKTYNTVALHRGSVRSVTFPNSSKLYYTTGADGKVLKNDLSGKNAAKVLSSSAYRNKIIAVSRDDKYLVSGGDSTFINIFDLKNETMPPKTIQVHKSHVNDIKFLPDNKSVITTGGDKRIVKVNIEKGSVEQLGMGTDEYKVIDVSRNGKYLATGAENGKVELYDLSGSVPVVKVVQSGNNIPVYSLGFSMDENTLAIGDEKGSVVLWNIQLNKEIRRLTSHKSRVSDIEFSENGQLLATASLDGVIHIWVLNEITELPIVLSDNDSYVWDMDFSPDSNYLLAACEDGEVRIWETNPGLMADKMCERLKRNMSRDEWDTYAGQDIPFRKTCSGK